MGNEKDVKKEEQKEVAPKRSLEDVLAENQRLKIENEQLKEQVQGARAVAQAYANAQQNLINSIKGTVNIATDNLQLITSSGGKR